MKYSVVIPTHNEEGNVAALQQEVDEVMQRMEGDYELIFVNDGSTDNTLGVLRTLHPVKVIDFRRNYGQTAALDAGIKQAQGEIIITMDADLQNDPKDVPVMLKKLEEGFDVVCGWRYKRQDPLMKKLVSRGAAFLRSFFINDGVHDSGCTLRVYRRECFAENGFGLYGEMHRFIPGILRWQGFRIGEIPVNHRPRRAGITKYNWRRTVKGLVDMINLWFWRKYSSRPVHIFGGFGALLSGLGSLFLVVLLILRAFGRISLANSVWPLLASVVILAGIQFLVSGIIADIAIRNYYSADSRNPYLVREIFEQ